MSSVACLTLSGVTYLCPYQFSNRDTHGLHDKQKHETEARERSEEEWLTPTSSIFAPFATFCSVLFCLQQHQLGIRR